MENIILENINLENIISEYKNLENIKKRGRPVKTDKDKKAYYQNFKNKHPQEITTRYECEICGGHYTYYTKSSHIKSKKHCKIIKIYNVDKVLEPITVKPINYEKIQDCMNKIKELKNSIKTLKEAKAEVLDVVE